MQGTISFTLNGRSITVKAEGDRMLLWVLREDLGLTGAKFGCGEGLCGACTVLVDERPLRSCVTALKDVAGKRVLTIEGLGSAAHLDPLQQAFLEHHAFQCGFCTPGMILSARALLAQNPHPTREEIVRHMDDNLCRCGSHTRVIQAIEAAAKGGAR